MARIEKVKLPDIGEGIAEGEIVRWLVKEGDKVKQFQPLVEVLTDKANVEIPSPVSGRVVRFLASEGERVSVGSPIVEIELEGEGESGAVEPEKSSGSVEEVKKGVSPELEEKVEAKKEERRIVRAPPSVRKLARDLGIDLAKVKGTGPGGVITRDDVLKYAQAQQGAQAQAAARAAETEKIQMEAVEKPQTQAVKAETAEQAVERVPLRGIRKIMAERMALAKSRIPHAYIVEEVDVTDLLSLRDHLAKYAEGKGIRLTILPFIVKAVVKALKEYPLLNSSLDEDRNEIVVKKYYNIGIAVDTEMGLVVPNIKNADRKGLFEIARDISMLASKARSGKLDLSDVRDGTFTITNIGSIGTVMGMPVINPPEVAILGVHRVVDKPVYIDGELKPRKVVNLSLSFDHRVIEGAYAARFLNLVKRYLEDPILLVVPDNELKV